ncbi:hypothetical protein ACA910_007717 [Epithemia clementina (nom. ined.)]
MHNLRSNNKSRTTGAFLFRVLIAAAVIAICRNDAVVAFRLTTTSSTSAVKSCRSAASRMTKTELMAWSIPTPDMSPLTSLTIGWYQECHPTARKTVYNDYLPDNTYTEPNYLDDDFWAPRYSQSRASLLMESSASLSSNNDVTDLGPRKGGRNPLRRAAKWAKRRFVRGENQQSQQQE